MVIGPFSYWTIWSSDRLASGPEHKLDGDWLIHSFFNWLIYSLIRSLIHSLTRSLIHSLTRSLIHSFVYSFIHWLLDWLIGVGVKKLLGLLDMVKQTEPGLRVNKLLSKLEEENFIELAAWSIRLRIRQMDSARSSFFICIQVCLYIGWNSHRGKSDGFRYYQQATLIFRSMCIGQQ